MSKKDIQDMILKLLAGGATYEEALAIASGKVKVRVTKEPKKK